MGGIETVHVVVSPLVSLFTVNFRFIYTSSLAEIVDCQAMVFINRVAQPEKTVPRPWEAAPMLSFRLIKFEKSPLFRRGRLLPTHPLKPSDREATIYGQS